MPARVPDLQPDRLSADQRRIYDEIRAGPRGSVSGPLAVWLASPELANHAQRLGAYCRYHSALPQRLSELALLVVGAYWKADFEWHVHHPIGVAAGLDPGNLEAIRKGIEPALSKPDEQAVYAFARELLIGHRVSPATYQTCEELLGHKGVVDLVGILGYYGLVCMTLVAFEVPVPEGAVPPFGEFAGPQVHGQ